MGEELVDYLEYVRDQSSDSIAVRQASIVASQCLSLITYDSDGVRILDFLGEAFQAVAKAAIDGIVEKAYRFALVERDRFAATRDEKLASRYRRLVAYFDSRKAIWGL